MTRAVTLICALCGIGVILVIPGHKAALGAIVLYEVTTILGLFAYSQWRGLK